MAVSVDETSRPRRALTVTCVRRHPEAGWWTARVTIDGGPTFDVDRRYGAWRYTPQINLTENIYAAVAYRECPTDVAEALQARVRPIEKKEARDDGSQPDTPPVAAAAQ